MPRIRKMLHRFIEKNPKAHGIIHGSDEAGLVPMRATEMHPQNPPEKARVNAAPNDAGSHAVHTALPFFQEMEWNTEKNNIHHTVMKQGHWGQTWVSAETWGQQ